MLVVVVLFVFAAMGTSLFSDDFALGLAVEAVREGAEDFRGCDTLGEVSCDRRGDGHPRQEATLDLCARATRSPRLFYYETAPVQ